MHVFFMTKIIFREKDDIEHYIMYDKIYQGNVDIKKLETYLVDAMGLNMIFEMVDDHVFEHDLEMEYIELP